MKEYEINEPEIIEYEEPEKKYTFEMISIKCDNCGYDIFEIRKGKYICCRCKFPFLCCGDS